MSAAAEPRLFPAELTPELAEVYGMMPWTTGPIAHALRADGAEIRRKCEAEQAFVMHWLTGLVLKHGVEWRAVAAAHVRSIYDRLEAAKAAAASAPPTS